MSPMEVADKRCRLLVLRNRIKMSFLAVCLMWATSLRVTVFFVSLFVDVPPFAVVMGTCNQTYHITRDEKGRYEDCVDSELKQCGQALDTKYRKEEWRVAATQQKNEDMIEAARSVQSNCSSAYSSLQYALRSMVATDDISSVGRFDVNETMALKGSFCSREDRDRLASLVRDKGAIRSEAFSISSDYSQESQSAVRQLAKYAHERVLYDKQYINNRTERIKDEVHAYIDGVDLPMLDVASVFESIQQDVERFLSCVTIRSVSYGQCNSFMGAQVRLNAIQQEMDRRIDIYVAEIDSWQQQMIKYKANVHDAFQVSERFYWGVKNAIPDWVDSSILMADWYKVDVTSFLPVDVRFPSRNPTFSQLPSVDAVWDSVSSSLDLLYAELDGAQVSVRNLAKELGKEVKLEMSLNLPNFTPYDYSPPVFTGSNSAIGSVFEEEEFHSQKSKRFLEQTALAFDAFSQLPSLEPAKKDLPRHIQSYFNISSEYSKLSDVNIHFESMVAAGIDQDVWILWLGYLGDAIFLFDLFFRIYSTIRHFYRYWSVGALTLPKVDLKSKMEKKPRNLLKMPTFRLVVLIITNPAMGVFTLTMTVGWLVSFAASVYAPIYQDYLVGCITPAGGGTFISKNLFSVAYNHAYQDGSSRLLNGLEKFDSARAKACSSSYATSATKYNYHATIFESLFDAQNRSTNQMDLMKRCLAKGALSDVYRKACCGVEGYESSCFTDNEKFNQTCPLNDMVQPAVPFLPPADYLANDACKVSFSRDPHWKMEDAVFICDNLPLCNNFCQGPNQAKIRRATRECGCMTEWYLHSLWLKIVLSLLVFSLCNTSRVVFVDGLARLYWQRLNSGVFVVETNCTQDGRLITKRIKDEKGEGKVQEYIKAEIDRNMIKYQAVGLALMVVAVFGIILCGYLLGCISHKAPSWLR